MDTPQTATPKKGKFANGAMVFAIVIVLNLFFNYAISLFYKAPEYGDYVPSSQVVQPITDQADCLAVGGQWTDPTPYNQPAPDTSVNSAPQTPVGYCDPTYTKEMQYADAQKSYERNVFIILVVLGVISLILAALLSNMILVLAFSWGGVLSLLIASVRYWSSAGSVLKVLILACALVALIAVAVKRFGK